jgi:hypothetical protein
MDKIVCVFFTQFLIALNVNAQSEIDSLYASNIDAWLKDKQFDYFSLKSKSFKDSVKHAEVYFGEYEGKLAGIYYRCLTCENTTMYAKNDSLICVNYQLSDPDIRSSLPPSTTFLIYFKNDKPVYSKEFNWMGGAKTCDAFTSEKKNFLQEFYYYKSFYGQKDD